MPKKAFLVGFCPLTRVVMDVPEDYNGDICSPTGERIIAAARRQIDECLANYLYGETCDRLEEDTECPFDPETEEPGNPGHMLKELVSKYGSDGVLDTDNLPEGTEMPAWSFLFDDDDCATLELKEILTLPGGGIEFRWKDTGYEYAETMDEMDGERLGYVLDCFNL